MGGALGMQVTAHAHDQRRRSRDAGLLPRLRDLDLDCTHARAGTRIRDKANTALRQQAGNVGIAEPV